MNHEQLKQNLSDFACIAYKKEVLVYSSKMRGIAPLVELCDINKENDELFVADKVIGKAAALLCIKCNVRMLFAKVISDAAIKILHDYGVDTRFDERVAFIENRTGTGKCPMEALAADTVSPDEMLKRAKDFLRSVNKG